MQKNLYGGAMKEKKKSFRERHKEYRRHFKFFDSIFWWKMASGVVTGLSIYILHHTNPELLEKILGFFEKYN
jgi:hypothetical protein